MKRQIVLDTETTGISPKEGHRIIEIGCMEMINRKITGERYHVYINPRREVEKAAQEVHGITDEFLKDKPFFEDIVKEFMDFLDNGELVIHNAPFDVGFINHELKLCRHHVQLVETQCSVLDTLAMARKMHPGQRNSLDALCKRYHVDNSQRDLHGALVDADLLAQVYLAMTGGQVKMTLDLDSGAKSKVNSNQIKNLSGYSTPVIRATAEELSEHQKYLDVIGADDSF